MRPDRPNPSKPRRDFFKKAALLGAAALLGGRRARSAAAGLAPAPRSDGRYRLTAHIRRYYERAAS
jgi:hypothetical protein